MIQFRKGEPKGSPFLVSFQSHSCFNLRLSRNSFAGSYRPSAAVLVREEDRVTAQEFSDNYIVRIYRHGRNSGQLVGIVEEVGLTHTDKRSFTTMEELWDIIDHGRPKEADCRCCVPRCCFRHRQ